MKLYDYQIDALHRMSNGCILNGKVGSGKSFTALAYYYICNGGQIDGENLSMMKDPQDLYIITTARKRDTREWAWDMIPFSLSDKKDNNLYSNNVIVDSWNNIKKYENISNSFFIFDEQRVVGKGVWVKAFLKIAKHNQWILLSATPGDTWMDYVPVFIANGFYRNRTDFETQHVIWKRFSKFPQIDRYLNTGRLIRLRNKILVNMDFKRKTEAEHFDIWCEYDVLKYKRVFKDRFDYDKNEPLKSAGEVCYALRKIVNSDISRINNFLNIFYKHNKIIVFYNYDYELNILKNINYGEDVEVAEWNGHKHQEIPTSRKWVYLVQYNAGAEGWNCILTDTIIFWSQTYSYKQLIQACGRIDRLNTPYQHLYYYHLKSRAGIDLAIGRALKDKKKFNETSFIICSHSQKN